MSGGTSDRRRIDEICLAALEHDPSERAAFVRVACGDDEQLRREVEALLAHAQTADGFLGAPIGVLAAGVMDTGSGLSLVGRTVGAYQILAAIGAGGMGEVYRARDTKLGRDVAIKVLSAAFTADRERLARFEREARVLASLNHPNIGAIYGLEQVDDVQALVLELVEGDTLADRIAKGRGQRAEGIGLPISEALTAARQIADALEAAHEKGIVHRDLKPANIKVTPAGVAKVLDFGLAKPVGHGFSRAGTAEAVPYESQTIGGTREGMLLGTAAYMSPEQARGQAVDKRADIWAFGCVLFEMLTGRMAFPGATVSDHIAAILEREPDWTALPPSTPPPIQRLLRRSLEKDPKRRLHDIADARIEIDAALLSEAPPATSAKGRRLGMSRRLAWTTAIVGTAALTGWLAWTFGVPRGSTIDRAVTRFVIQPPAATPMLGGFFDISPDGSELVYVGLDRGVRRLFLRRLDQFDAVPLAGTEGAGPACFSSDGQWVGFVAEGKLQKINIRTAAPPVVLRDGTAINNVEWQGDTIFFDGVKRGIQRVSAEGGEAAVVAALRPDAEFDHHNPQLLPGDRALLFTIHQGVERFSVAIQSLSSGERRVLIDSAFDARYASSGHIVYATGSVIRAAPFDLSRLAITGPPVTLVEHVATFPNDGRGDFKLSNNGSLVFQPEQSAAGRRLTWVDRSGTETPVPLPPRAFTSARISPDGKRVAFAAADGDREDIWIYELATDTLTRATLEDVNRAPAWTSDGRHLAYEKVRAGTHHVFWQPSDGSGPPESLVSGADRLHPSAWTRDGSALIYVDSPPSDLSEIRILRRDRESRSQPLIHKPPAAWTDLPSFSPDGRWLTYTSNESGRPEIYVQAYPASGSRHQVTNEGGFASVWSRDGRELFFRNEGSMFAVPVDTAHGFSAGKPVRLFGGTYVLRRLAGVPYDVAPNGRFLMIKSSDEELAPPRLNVVLNWVDELARRVATGRR